MKSRFGLLLVLVLLCGFALTAVASPAAAADYWTISLSSSTHRSTTGKEVTLTAQLQGFSYPASQGFENKPVPGSSFVLAAAAADTVTFVANHETLGSSAINWADSGQVHGTASFTYTRKSPTSDSIVATFGKVSSNMVDVEWSDPPISQELTLSPDGARSAVGQIFTATATLKQEGQPLSGRTIHFQATCPGQPTRTADEQTAGGEARFSYTRPATCTDSITAVFEDTNVRAGIRHTWFPLITTPPTSPTTSTSPPTTSTSPPTTSTAPPTTSTSPPTTPPAVAAGNPGGDTTFSGGGCQPGRIVTVTVDGKRVGKVVADSKGHWRWRGPLPHLPLGRHQVRTNCPGTTTQTLDVVASTAQTGTAAASLVTSAAVLMFFLLLGFSALRASGRPRKATAPPRHTWPRS